MIRPGLVSVTFRKLSPRRIVELATEAKLEAIEWGADVHVPPDGPGVAREVAAMTSDAGLAVASYGSYYHAAGEDPGAFERVLETAAILGAPTVRVWGGRLGSAEASDQDRKAVTADLLRIARLAATQGRTISLEFHGGTLTDTIESADRLFAELRAADPEAAANVFSYWQPPVGMELNALKDSLRRTLPRLSNVHVYHWAEYERRALADGRERWRECFAMVRAAGREHWALLEFVRDDSAEALREDARVLRELLQG